MASALCRNNLPPNSIIFGQSAAMQAVRQRVEKVALANVPILIQGESGTGKEVLARLIHMLSPRGTGNFVKLNCAAIPHNLLESELFGYGKGAFTGAYTSKPGRVEFANHGSLFLDHIAEIDLALQGKLLQFLQDGQYSPIGELVDKRADARIISSTHEPLEQVVEARRFRIDLLYRINVVCISLPRLKDRREDIPLLADYFLSLYNDRFSQHAVPLRQHAISYLENQKWPGNIRELESCIARYVVLGTEEAVYGEQVRKHIARGALPTEAGGTIPLKRVAKEAVKKMEQDLILKVLQANHWNRRRAAQALRISYRALIYKLREIESSLPTNRRPSQAATPKVETAHHLTGDS